MRTKFLYSLFSICLILIFYLSWTSDPRLSATGILPSWVSDWTDTKQNETIRTGVPFLILGLVTGIYLYIQNLKSRSWLYAFLILLFMVCLAELGQLFLPLRNCDVYDVLWGAFGSGTGLLVIYPFKYVFNR